MGAARLDQRMAKLPRYILALWIALTASVQAIGGLEGLVLCVSTRGHIALELAHRDPSCATSCETAFSAVDEAAIEAALESCCTDVAFARLDLRTDRRGVAPDASDVTPAPDVDGVAPWRGMDGFTPLWPDERSRAAADDGRLLASRTLRTVVLLI